MHAEKQLLHSSYLMLQSMMTVFLPVTSKLSPYCTVWGWLWTSMYTSQQLQEMITSHTTM